MSREESFAVVQERLRKHKAFLFRGFSHHYISHDAEQTDERRTLMLNSIFSGVFLLILCAVFSQASLRANVPVLIKILIQIALSLFFVFWCFREWLCLKKHQEMERYGILILGEFSDIQAGSSSDSSDVKINYSFVSPNGEQITATTEGADPRPLDLRKYNAVILYLDDKNYQLL